MIPTVFSSVRYKDNNDLEVGGPCQIFTPAAALNYGDVVYFSAANTVTKAATAANYVSFAGVVVGGDLTGNERLLTKPTSGTVAVASASGSVLVQIGGVAEVITIGTDAAGSRVMASGVTAGYVVAGTTAGQMLGTLIDTGVAGNLKRMLIAHR